jgi:hypothetical protein
MKPLRLLAALALVAAFATGCVGNAATTGAYRGKASHSAKAAVSALQTALLAVQLEKKGKMLGGYLDVVMSRAEDDFSSVQQQFDSIQPPNSDEADRIRDQLDKLFTSGTQILSQLRILERRDDKIALTKVATGIPGLVGKLNTLAQETA